MSDVPSSQLRLSQPLSVPLSRLTDPDVTSLDTVQIKPFQFIAQRIEQPLQKIGSHQIDPILPEDQNDGTDYFKSPKQMQDMSSIMIRGLKGCDEEIKQPIDQRKNSLMDCDAISQDIDEDDDDLPLKIHFKPDKKKAFFMQFLKKENTKYTANISGNLQDQALFDKRSRSETPNKMCAREVLYRAHQKLQSRLRKESPSKLIQKQQQRQKNAEELRAKIELGRKMLYDKIRIRQQGVKDKQMETLEQKKARLFDRLEQADERRETEIQSLVNKAKQEIQKIDETNYIMKMTMNNMKMDLDMKMSETLERRTHILEEFKQKHHFSIMKKKDAFEKRRQELQNQSVNKFLSNQQRREQAERRRKKMLGQKKKIAEEMDKRAKIIQRKNELGGKISDILSFVSNSENLWELIGNEMDWRELYTKEGESTIFDLIQKDHYEIEKMRLKKDSEILNQIIVIGEDGQITARKNLLGMAWKKIQRNKEQNNISSSDGIDPESEYDLRIENQHSSPLTIHQDSRKQVHSEGYFSDGSDSRSFSEETIRHAPTFGGAAKDQLLTDEDEKYALYSIRVKMSMKRNILKKNLSEDLTWADFLKNEENYQNIRTANPMYSSFLSRSLHSTPERKHEIPCESGGDTQTIDQQFPQPNNRMSGGVISNSHSKKMVHKIKSGINNAGILQNQNPNHSVSSNQSEKSRISAVVYPSKKKKNPNNRANVNQNEQRTNELKTNESQNSVKKGSSGSNNESSKSLVGQTIHSLRSSFQNQESRDSLNNNINQIQRKSTMMETNFDSVKKVYQTRIHSSSVQENSNNFSVILSKQQNNPDDVHSGMDRNTDQTQESSQTMHTGAQMSSLIINSKPNPILNKIVPKKLSANAIKLLFPIREQKLLFKRQGKDGHFCKSKVTIKIEDLSHMVRLPIIVNQNLANQALSQQPLIGDNNDLITQKNQLQMLGEQVQASSSRKSLQSTPQVSQRKQSTDTNNSLSNNQQSTSTINPNNESIEISTPTQHNKTLSLNQRMQMQGLFESKIPKISGSKMGNIQATESSPSPKKDAQELLSKPVQEEVNTSQQNISLSLINLTDILPQMNEVGYKELLIKFLITDHIQLIKNEESQKTIVLEGSEGDRLIDYLETHDIQLKYCRICDLIIPDHSSAENHLQLKSHRRTRDDLYIKDHEDLAYSIFTLNAYPGDIDKELYKEKEKALKRKVKRIKAQMTAIAESHENASSCPGKEITSTNKKRFQIICIELEKQVIPIIKDYDILEKTLQEIIKLLDMRKQPDLHVMRKLKFIPVLIEICKRILVCHKNEFKYLGKVLDYVVNIINIFCGLRENRNYMLQTNRLQALIELLNWCLNRPIQLFYAIPFLPALFNIITMHVKHRAPYECQQQKELFIEYLICSQITIKIKSKFQIISGPLDLSEMLGQVPLFLLKSATFIESLTSLLSADAKIRPVYEKSQKIGEHLLFIIQSNELFGIIPMITTILLTRNQPFKPSTQSQPQQIHKILPQTILSLAIISIKILNNVFRMDYKFTQQMMNDFDFQDQLYHLFNYLLVYGSETQEQQEDSKELLHETILMIGYFCLLNEKNQQLLCKGENTILQKLCNLPFPYFCDKKLKEILFPTLIQASYKNERSLAIMDQELSIELIVDFMNLNIKEELPKIVEEEFEQQSMSSFGHQTTSGLDKKANRSPSLSSTNSSNCSFQLDMVNGNSPFLPLYMRFPKKQWKDAITFYSKVLF